MNNLIEQFRLAITAAGLIPPTDIMDDGAIHRFSTSGKPTHKNGWYLLHTDGIAAGVFGDWGEGFTQNWCSKTDTAMTDGERLAHRERIKAMQRQREDDLAQCQQFAAADALKRWTAATPCTEHDYLTRKGIQAHSAKVEGDKLLIPMRDTAGMVHSLQTIAPDGTKMFMSGGRVKGCYFGIGKPKGALIVCEGFATGASIHECTNHAVAVAFNAGNLEAVAVALRSKYPTLKIIIAADDDHQTPGNPGVTKATAAARATHAILAIPVFNGSGGMNNMTDFNDLHRLVGSEAVKECIELAIHSAATQEDATDSTDPLGAWPTPQEIKRDLPLAPEFDAKSLLPPTLANFVLDEADRMACPPDYIAATLLVCAGAVIGASCGIKPKRYDDWIVTPNLFGGIVGEPSSKKSPALGTVTRFLDRLEANAAETMQDARKIYASEMAAYEAHHAAVKNNMKKAANGKVDHLKMNAAMADMQALQAPEEPKVRRFKSNDATVEKLGDLLVHNQRGILVYRDELIGQLAAWDKEGKEGDRAFYLEGWNGTGSFNIDRIGRGSLHIKNLCISMFGGIQPEMLERYLAGMAATLDNDGRIQRFQVMVYPDPVHWVWRDRYPVKGAREEVRDLFDRLAVFDPVQDGALPNDDFVKLPYFCFDDAAQEIFIEWCTNLHTVDIVNEPSPLMQQHLGKFEKLFCSVALILHLAEGSIGPVTATSAMRAVAWCKYLASHARRIYGTVETGKVTAAQRVSQRLAEGKIADGFTARDLARKHWTGVTTTMQAEAALTILEENGHVQSQDGIAQGRPTVRYHVNPKIKKVAK